MIAFVNVNAQSLELSPVLNLSTDPRFDKCAGIGLMYSHRISKKYSLGLSVYYKSLHSNFAELNQPEYLDDPNDPIYFSHINAKSNNISIRTGVQHHIIDKEKIGFSLGPELSYIRQWSSEKSFSYYIDKGNSYYSSYNDLHHMLGVDMLIKLELKKIIIERLSICINTRPELAIDISSAPFGYNIGNIEFMIGTKYKLRKD